MTLRVLLANILYRFWNLTGTFGFDILTKSFQPCHFSVCFDRLMWFLSTQLGRGSYFYFLLKSHAFCMKYMWKEILTTLLGIWTPTDESWSWHRRPHILTVMGFWSLFIISIICVVLPEIFSYFPPSSSFLVGSVHKIWCWSLFSKRMFETVYSVSDFWRLNFCR